MVLYLPTLTAVLMAEDAPVPTVALGYFGALTASVGVGYQPLKWLSAGGQLGYNFMIGGLRRRPQLANRLTPQEQPPHLGTWHFEKNSVISFSISKEFTWAWVGS